MHQSCQKDGPGFGRMMSRRSVALSLAGGMLVFPLSSLAEEVSEPERVVRALASDLGELARESNDMAPGARLDAVSTLIKTYFDLDRIAENTLGVRRFRGLSAAQQSRFIDAYTRFTFASYTRRLPEFDRTGFEVVNTKEGPPGLQAVRARYVSEGQGSAVLDFVLGMMGQEWRIVDVRIDGAISELAVRRSEVSSILEQDGFDGLLALLETRTEALIDGAQS